MTCHNIPIQRLKGKYGQQPVLELWTPQEHKIYSLFSAKFHTEKSVNRRVLYFYFEVHFEVHKYSKLEKKMI